MYNQDHVYSVSAFVRIQEYSTSAMLPFPQLLIQFYFFNKKYIHCKTIVHGGNSCVVSGGGFPTFGVINSLVLAECRP